MQASWDSTVHDTNSLNRITSDKDRVFAIVKVSIRLKHPPSIVLVLRKRICLRVYKKSGMLSFLRSFAAPKVGRLCYGTVLSVLIIVPLSLVAGDQEWM